MEDQIAKVIAEKAGIDPAAAQKAAAAVIGFIKENPHKITALLGGPKAGIVSRLFGK